MASSWEAWELEGSWSGSQRTRADGLEAPLPALRPCDALVTLGPAVAIKLPDVAHFLNLIQVEVCDHDFILVAAPHRNDLAARIAEVTGAIELANGPGFFETNAIDRAHEVLIGNRVGGLLELP